MNECARLGLGLNVSKKGKQDKQERPVNIRLNELNISSFTNKSISQTHAAKSLHSKQLDVFQRFKYNDQYIL